MISFRRLLFFLPLTLFAAGFQGGAVQPLTDASEAESSAPKDVTPQFRAEVDQVVVYATVTDADGTPVRDLPLEDFTVLEDGVVQEVTYFGQDDVPSSVGIVMDVSGSMRNKMNLVNQATRLFLEKTNPENELFLISFKHEVKLEESFTRDPADIRDALDNLLVSGGTALWDAVYLAASEIEEGSEQKRALVVFTDGEDNASYYEHAELVARVRGVDAQVHMVAFLDEDLRRQRGGFFGIFRSEKNRIEDKLKELSDASGGLTFFPESNSELREVFRTIAESMRSQYRIAYVSGNPKKDGGWRDIQVQVRGAEENGYSVQARSGYYAYAEGLGETNGRD